MDDEGNINQVRLPIAKKNQKISFDDIPEGPIKEQIRNLSMQYVLAESYGGVGGGPRNQPSQEEMNMILEGTLAPDDVFATYGKETPIDTFGREVLRTLTPEKILNASRKEIFSEYNKWSLLEKDEGLEFPLSVPMTDLPGPVALGQSLVGRGGITFTNNGQKIINKIDLVGIGDLGDIRALFKDAFYDRKTQQYVANLPYNLFSSIDNNNRILVAENQEGG